MNTKFRAWHKKEKKMYEVITLYLGGTDAVELWKGNKFALVEDDKTKFILLQSTGLKDKNGKEMFWDDLIKIGDIIYRIIFDEFGILTAMPLDDKLTKQMLGVVMKIEKVEVEVIGNIHENPELLKGAKP